MSVIVGMKSGIGRPVSGIARHANHNGSNIKPGEIMVSEDTDAHMVMGMKLAAGIVTQRGGRFSHAAIVCLDWGKPLVLGVANVLEAIPDGSRVTINPATGEVTVG